MLRIGSKQAIARCVEATRLTAVMTAFHFSMRHLCFRFPSGTEFLFPSSEGRYSTSSIGRATGAVSSLQRKSAFVAVGSRLGFKIDMDPDYGLNQKSESARAMTTKDQPARAPGMGEITRLLEQMREGTPKAAEELVSRVYPELRMLAARKMASELPGQTLQPTALVHEAWLRLFGGNGLECPNRAYFFAAAGEAMRRILVENARRKKRLKRGGNPERVDVDELNLAAPLPDDELLELDEALTRFAQSDPKAAEFVKIHYFVGLTQEQAAKELGVSLSTVERTLAYAKAWLFREIRRGRHPQC